MNDHSVRCLTYIPWIYKAFPVQIESKDECLLSATFEQYSCTNSVQSLTNRTSMKCTGIDRDMGQTTIRIRVTDKCFTQIPSWSITWCQQIPNMKQMNMAWGGTLWNCYKLEAHLSQITLLPTFHGLCVEVPTNKVTEWEETGRREGGLPQRPVSPSYVERENTGGWRSSTLHSGRLEEQPEEQGR